MKLSKNYKCKVKISFSMTILLAIFIVISLAFSCDGTLKEKYLFEDIIVTDTIIEEHNNIQLQLDIDFPSKYKNKLTYIKFQPLLVSRENDTVFFKSYKIQGEKVKDNFEIVSYEEGKEIHYIDKIIVESKSTFDRLLLKVDFMNSGKLNAELHEYYLIHEY